MGLIGVPADLGDIAVVGDSCDTADYERTELQGDCLVGIGQIFIQIGDGLEISSNHLPRQLVNSHPLCDVLGLGIVPTEDIALGCNQSRKECSKEDQRYVLHFN